MNKIVEMLAKKVVEKKIKIDEIGNAFNLKRKVKEKVKELQKEV